MFFLIKNSQNVLSIELIHSQLVIKKKIYVFLCFYEFFICSVQLEQSNLST